MDFEVRSFILLKRLICNQVNRPDFGFDLSTNGLK